MMTAPERMGLCEMSDCGHLAQGWVEAQWTVVDFVRYEACFGCMPIMERELYRRRVDGLAPARVSVGYYA